MIPRLLSYIVLIARLDQSEHTWPYRDAVAIQIVLHFFLLSRNLSVLFLDYKPAPALLQARAQFGPELWNLSLVRFLSSNPC